MTPRKTARPDPLIPRAFPATLASAACQRLHAGWTKPSMAAKQPHKYLVVKERMSCERSTKNGFITSALASFHGSNARRLWVLFEWA